MLVWDSLSSTFFFVFWIILSVRRSVFVCLRGASVCVCVCVCVCVTVCVRERGGGGLSSARQKCIPHLHFFEVTIAEGEDKRCFPCSFCSGVDKKTEAVSGRSCGKASRAIASEQARRKLGNDLVIKNPVTSFSTSCNLMGAVRGEGRERGGGGGRGEEGFILHPAHRQGWKEGTVGE